MTTLSGKALARAAIVVVGATVGYFALSCGNSAPQFPPSTVTGQVVAETVWPNRDYSFTVQTRNGNLVEFRLQEKTNGNATKRLEDELEIGSIVDVTGFTNMNCENYDCSRGVRNLERPFQIYDYKKQKESRYPPCIPVLLMC